MNSNHLPGFVLLVFVAGLSLESQEVRFRESQNYGLQGPIHTQLDTSRKLIENPPKGHKLFIPEPEGWIEFDPAGKVIEHGSVNESGKIMTLVREKRDAEGQTTESAVFNGDKTIHYYTQKSILPSGGIESVTFADGNAFSRHISNYNAQTGQEEDIGFDGSGQMVHHSISYRSSTRLENQVWGLNGKFVTHYMQRYDQQGELIESVMLDAQGRVVSDFSFKDGILTSWWQDPKCECTNDGGFVWPYSHAISYQTTEQGALLKTVQHHKGRVGNIEVDDEELYDENDHLLERISYAYERDQYGNWTRRVAAMLDIKTGEMIPVREDIRKLTYY